MTHKNALDYATRLTKRPKAQHLTQSSGVGVLSPLPRWERARVRVKRNSQELARLRKPVEQKNAAQRLRKASTDAERKLWSILRNRQLSSYKFRRQIPLRNYIVDFVCFEAKLVIEVDGGHHQEQSGHDEMRTRGLMEGGFRVLRFWNNQVLTNPESVQKAILAELESSNTSD